MRIGLIAPPWIPVPPPAYGGTEIVIDYLARGLMARGHDVRLFTVGESTCPVPRQWLFRSPVEPMGACAQEAAHVLAAYEALADVDIIHDHTVMGPQLAGRRGIPRQPVVTTIHGPFTPQSRRTLAEVARHASIVAISHAHARCFGDIPVAAVIHHGIDLDIHKPGPGTGGYLLFVGRMSAEKGAHHAVRVARRAGWPLVISAKIRDPAERAYFDQQVRPLLGPGDDMPAEQPLTVRLDLMRHAAALVNPITWPEPFGLVMAEALAAATPVLALPNGAAPEIIDQGRTGYLCRDEEEMIAAVDHVHQIDRWQCRTVAERRCSLARMAADYERLYRALLEHPGQPCQAVRLVIPCTVSGLGISFPSPYCCDRRQGLISPATCGSRAFTRLVGIAGRREFLTAAAPDAHRGGNPLALQPDPDPLKRGDRVAATGGP